MMTPNQSPEPTAVPSSRSFGAKADGAGSSAVPPSFHFGATGAVHAARRRWLSFLRIIRMRHFRKVIQIAVIVLLVLGLAVGWMAMSICWPASEHDMRVVASAMMQFYNQPHPHGIWNEDLPASITDRGRRYYRSDPACDVQHGYMSVEYYYRRFGIVYEPRFTLYQGRIIYQGNTNDPIWTLEPGITFWNPWKHEHYYFKEHSIT